MLGAYDGGPEAMIALPLKFSVSKVGAQPADIEAAYKRLALEHHPDRGGSTEKMAALNAARDAALAVHLSAAVSPCHAPRPGAALRGGARTAVAVLALRATKQEPLEASVVDSADRAALRDR
jgi:hypothetical protein